jgi:hypothetical protein
MLGILRVAAHGRRRGCLTTVDHLCQTQPPDALACTFRMLAGKSKGAIRIVSLNRVDYRFVLAVIATDRFTGEGNCQYPRDPLELLDEVGGDRSDALVTRQVSDRPMDSL